MKYIIYHQVKKGVDCPDGLMAASIAALACPKAELLGDVACWKICIEDPKNDRLVSQIGAAVCQAKGEGTVCWIETSSGLNSLRSNGVDISGYAKALGGGGHPFASGWPRE